MPSLRGGPVPSTALTLVLAVFAGLVALFFIALKREDPEALPSAFVGRTAPALSVEPFAGEPVLDDLTLHAPEAKLVNFWASWCAPCRVEHPNLTTLAEAGYAVHGINYKDTPAQARQFLEQLGNPFTTLAADPSGRTGIDWGIYGVPETFVVGADGRILHRHAGPITLRSLERSILPALADAASE